MGQSLSEVTYTRDPSGNLVKVPRPRELSLVSKAKRLHASSKVERDKVPKSGAEPVHSKAPCGRKGVDAVERIARIPLVVRSVAVKIAFRYGITLRALVGNERVRHTVRARHEWWRLVRDTWDLSYPETARLVGGVHHTSVMAALRAPAACPSPMTHVGDPSPV
jgi:Bacterial dnaA protein helix-turn-helix